MKTKHKKTKLHVKIGDQVKIISGAEKGKIGEVIKTFKTQGRVIVKNLNMKTKHSRPQQEGETGRITKQEASIDSSNVMLYNPEHKVASRYRRIIDKKGKQKRVLIKLEKI
jgi:large subunit ribosomal protein L24